VDFSDNFDSDEQLAVRIGRDSVKFSIMEMMRDLRSDTRVLTEIEEGNNNVKLNELSCEERQIVMMWAAFLKRKDVLERLLAKKDCNLQICTPEDRLSALHLAAYSGCQECVNLLINAGAKMTHHQEYSPLHCAALSASLPCVRLLLSHGAKVDSKSQDLPSDYLQDTPLHCAIKANSPECVKQLLQAGADPSALGQGGLSPLHVAGDLAYLGCMRALLDFGLIGRSKANFDINQVTKDGRGYTTLHIVTEDQFTDGIRLLKEYSVNTKVKSTKGLTALHIAAREQSVECAKLLVEDSDVNDLENEGRTPLHMALGRSEAAEITDFLTNILGIQVNKADKYGFTPLHVAAVNEQAQAAAILIRAGADLTARTDKGSTALRMVIRKVPTALYAVEEVMDSSISLNNNMDSRDVELKLDFKPLLASKKRITTDLLNTFIAEGHPELMQHPLCQAFLHIKWQEVRIFYLLRLVYYFVFLCFISVYVIAFLSNSCTVVNNEVVKNDSSCKDDAPPISARKHFILLNFIYKGLIYVAIFEVIRKLYGLIAFCIAPTSVSLSSSLQIYCCQVDNWLEWSCLAFVAIIGGLDRQSWHVYVGALAVLAGWSNLMILIGQLPYFGAYVAMYTCVLREMGKLLMAYVCMLIGFTVSFHVVFRNRKGFSSFWTSMVKILVMMTGELEFNDLFTVEKPENTSIPIETNKLQVRLFSYDSMSREADVNEVADVELFAYIIFTIFLLLVTVVLMNLLVGIAVHDIHGLRTSAVISRLQRQADLIGYIETALPSFCTIRLLIYCCFCFIPFINNRTASAGGRRRRRRTEVGILSVQPHNLQKNNLPREIVSAAFEVAKRMNPYKGNQKSSKGKPRYKRIYSKQHSGSIYETIIPRTHDNKKPGFFNRSSQYLNVNKMLDSFETHSEHSENSKTLADEIKDLKEALAQQTALLQQLLGSNKINASAQQPPLSEC
jgi:ankyrin repeat protein